MLSYFCLDRKFNIYSSLLSKDNSEQSGNIGETLIEDNSEINSEIKESESLYSVDLEPLNENIIDPRVSDILN